MIELSTQEVNFDSCSLFVDRKYVAASIANAVKRASDVHPHPGPVTIKVSNITSAETHRDHLGQDKADLHFVSEASLAKSKIAEVRTYLRETYKKEASFTLTDTEMGHLTGGVGAIAKAPHRLVEVKPVTPEFDELSATLGRAALYAVEFKGGHTVTFVVVYGWTGGAQDAKAANRTSDMFKIIFNELKMQPDGPQFIMGDVNATTAGIMSLNLALLTPEGDSHAWHDVGALAELWGAVAV